MKFSWINAAASRVLKDSAFSDDNGFERFVSFQLRNANDARNAVRDLQYGLVELERMKDVVLRVTSETDLSIKGAAVSEYRAAQRMDLHPAQMERVREIMGGVASDMLDKNERYTEKFDKFINDRAALYAQRITVIEQRFGLPPSNPQPAAAPHVALTSERR